MTQLLMGKVEVLVAEEVLVVEAVADVVDVVVVVVLVMGLREILRILRVMSTLLVLTKLLPNIKLLLTSVRSQRLHLHLIMMYMENT